MRQNSRTTAWACAKKLSPILAFYVVPNLAGGIALCRRLLEFGGGEAGGDVFHNVGGEDFAEDYESDQDEAHYGDYRGKNAPAFVFALFGYVFGEDGDKGDAEGAAGD